jgi:predicted nucleic acid-binding protein
MIRCLIDVNVIISAVLTPRGTVRAVYEYWHAGRFEHVSSHSIADRIGSKLMDAKIGGRYNVSRADVVAVQALILTNSELFSPSALEIQPVTGDPEDDEILAL